MFKIYSSIRLLGKEWWEWGLIKKELGKNLKQSLCKWEEDQELEGAGKEETKTRIKIGYVCILVFHDKCDCCVLQIYTNKKDQKRISTEFISILLFLFKYPM